MRAITYEVKTVNIPNTSGFSEAFTRGLAYETDAHFVHMFARGSGLWDVPGLAATEGKSGTLRNWVEGIFSATEICDMKLNVGEVHSHVWRPGLNKEEIINNKYEDSVRLSEQVVLLLIQKLDEILNYIEPNMASMHVYGHKTRDLLILACTEVELLLRNYLDLFNYRKSNGGNFSTNDYVKLCDLLHLREFEVTLPRYAGVPPMRPFSNWSAMSPTQSLSWYAAYNNTKHNRGSNFHDASIAHCLQAVAAVLVLFSVRFGPMRLFEGKGTLSAFFNQLFSIEIKDCCPSTFYVPNIEISADYWPSLQINSFYGKLRSPVEVQLIM